MSSFRTLTFPAGFSLPFVFLPGTVRGQEPDGGWPGDSPFVLAGDSVRVVELDHWFEGIDPGDATLAVVDGETGLTTLFNAGRARECFLPASTFKIPHTLIALESHVADGPDFTLEWDGKELEDGSFWPASWSQNHTLRSALRNSVVWFYQEIARRIGRERMQRYLDRVAYGNRKMGPLDRFWLEGDGVWERWGPPAARGDLLRDLLRDVGVLPEGDSVARVVAPHRSQPEPSHCTKGHKSFKTHR